MSRNSLEYHIKRKSKNLTQETLKQLISYNPETGEFTRLKSAGGRDKDTKAGSIMNTGYLEVGVNGERWLGHRLAFLYMEGKVPDYIDHKDSDRSNNIWSNLRACTQAQNLANTIPRKNTITGIKNVGIHKASGLYHVTLWSNNKLAHSSYHKDIELAALVAEEARNKYHGEFARHN